jgi:hypothetical protein
MIFQPTYSHVLEKLEPGAKALTAQERSFPFRPIDQRREAAQRRCRVHRSSPQTGRGRNLHLVLALYQP